MNASCLEVLFDPSKCSKLSIDQKRELVHELSKWSDGAIEILHTWSRHDILQILCAELGKERKYTGLNKTKIIEQLLKIIQEKKRDSNSTAPEIIQQPLSENDETMNVGPHDITTVHYCKNSACRAKMSREDAFCKRCSCCICSEYDDNKDPSLWLVCNSESPFCSVSCGLSCHLECALRHKNSKGSSLDGSFFCASCGKVNDLLGSWKKQLIVAKDTRRVDILCYRLCLAQKILDGTKLYQNLRVSIDEAVKKLEQEVGPLTGLPVKMARGIVNRLSLGPEIQRLCADALKSLDLMLSARESDTFSDCTALASKPVRIEDVNNTSSVTMENETTNNVMPCGIDNYDKTSEPNLSIDCSDNMTNNKVNTLSNALQITPQKIEEKLKNENFSKKKNRRKTEPQAGGSSSKKRRENREGDCNDDDIEEKKDFEYYVKVIRRLESDGYIETGFRQKFLTWYSLRATSREVRVVRVFVDTFLEDSESLAGQLVDAFSDFVSDKKCSSSSSIVPVGFCKKLWH